MENNTPTQRLLTAENKDNLLNVLVESCIVGQAYIQAEYSAIIQEAGLNDQEFHALLMQFKRHGLIEYDGIIHQGYKIFDFVLHQEAIDFKLHGGFKMEEEIFDAKMSSLFNEIENLKRSNPLADFANISTIATGIFELGKVIFKTQ